MEAIHPTFTDEERNLFFELGYSFNNNDVYRSINELSSKIAEKIGASSIKVYKYDKEKKYSRVMEAGQEETPMDRIIADRINGIEGNFDIKLDDEQIRRLTGIKMGDFFLVATNIYDLENNREKVSQIKRVVERILDNASAAIDYTGLKTRSCYDRKVANYLMEPEKQVTIVSIDLFNLKGVNDVSGDHIKGDEYIKGVANVLGKNFKDFGSVYRIGGDEFIVLVENNYENIKEELIYRVGKSCRETSELDIGLPGTILRLNYGIACTSSHRIEMGRGEADKLLKENKTNMYIALGIDRRHAKLNNSSVSFRKPM